MSSPCSDGAQSWHVCRDVDNLPRLATPTDDPAVGTECIETLLTTRHRDAIGKLFGQGNGYRSINRKAADAVIAANPDKVAEYKSGKDKLFGFFVGQTMKAMQGKANPQIINDLLKKALG